MQVGPLINFLNQLERKSVLSRKANHKIQHYLDFSTVEYGKLFLVLSGVIGAVFVSAGIFSILMHNWDDIPKHIRGILSIVPLLITLYFYYRAVFEKKTTVWIEVTSILVFMAIGSSIALISSTYNLNGDFDRFIIVWLFLSIPLFYIGKASAFVFFYLLLTCYFAFPNIYWFWGIPGGFEPNDKIYWFWIFIAAFLPHFILQINFYSKKQSIRTVYLGWLLALTFYVMLPFVVTGGYVFWGLSLVLGFIILGNKYFSDNLSIFGKPFQFVAYFALFFSLLGLSTETHTLKELFRIENYQNISYFDPIAILFLILGITCLTLLTVYAFKNFRKEGMMAALISYLPILIVFLMLLHYINEIYYFDMKWIGWIIFNIYLIVFGISALIKGTNSRNMAALFYGLFFICAFLWIKYFSMEISFWLKGLLFLAVGVAFFLINFIYSEELAYTTRNDDEITFKNEEE